MSNAKRIVVLGSLNTDMVTVTSRIPAGGETFTAISFSTAVGGKGNNQAVGCARAAISHNDTAEIQVVMLGATGTSEDDALSDTLHETLDREGIDRTGIVRIPGISSGTATILVEQETGQNRILVVPGANGKVDKSFLDKPSFQSMLWGDGRTPKASLLVMQLEIPLATVLEATSQANEHGVPVLLNPAPALKDIPKDILARVDHLIVNETEAAILLTDHTDLADLETASEAWCRQVFKSFSRLGVKHLTVTLGEKGACFTDSSDKGYGFVPAVNVPAEKIIDTTAAGDTFVGAYAVELVQADKDNFDIKQAIERACKASALTVQKAGAIPSIPRGCDY